MPLTITDTTPYIFLVKTDQVFARRAETDIKGEGYIPVVVSDLSTGFHHFNELQPAMVVLDYAAVGELGIRFCHQLRSSGSQVPVLMLIDQATVDKRAACLEAGADDYLLKPYRSEAFLQSVRLYLQPTDTETEKLRFGDLILDLTNRRALRGGKETELTVKEFELLKYLMSHPQEVVSREQIIENVWGYDFSGESNVIEVYIRYLRLKTEQQGQKRLIHTVRGIGYVLRS